MLSQALRTRQHASICRSHIHQHFNHALISTTSEKDARIPIGPKKVNRTAFIRTWEPFHSLAETYLLLRAVERKYGKVIEGHFLKDFEVKNAYQMHIYVVFRDQESLELIPKSGSYSFYIPSTAIEEKPGGLGLDDIKHLLDSTERDEFFEFPSAASLDKKKSKERKIGAVIQRAGVDFSTVPRTRAFIPASPKRSLAREFLKWGGFHKLEPIEARDITEDEWFEKPEWEQVHMRAALQRCSQATGFANPAVIGAHQKNREGSNSSPASASMDSPESSSPPALDIPITHESTSKSTESRSLLTEFPQSPSHSPPEPTQLPPEPTPPQSPSPSLHEPNQPHPEPTPPKPTILPPGQLTLEQKKALQRQMSRAQQLSKQPAARKAQKPKKKRGLEDQMPHMRDKFPEIPLQPQSDNIVASIWKFFGR